MPKRYPLHIHVSSLFLLLIMVVGGLLLGIGYVTSRDFINSAADDLTDRISRETAGEFRQILRPVDTVMSVLSLDPLTKASSLDQRMVRMSLIKSLLDRNEVLSSLYVGYANGDFFMIRHVHSEEERLRLGAPLGTEYVIQSIERGRKAPQGEYLYLNARLQVLKKTSQPNYPKSYDPRQREWYLEALKADHSVLTSPYLFFSDRQVGVTMAVHAKQPGVVVGADIQLRTLSDSLGKQKVTPHSQLVLTDSNGTIVAHENASRLVRISDGDERPQLTTLETFGIPVLKAIYEAIDLRQIPSSGWLKRTLDADSETWQVSANKLQMNGADALLLVIAVPKHELLAAAYTQSWIAAIGTFLVILFSIPIAWWSARAISRPLVALTDETDAIRHFDFGHPFDLQSRILEINKLALTIGKMKQTIQRFLDLTDAISAEQNFDLLLPKLLKETVAVTDTSSGILYLNKPTGLAPICALSPDGRNLSDQELSQLHQLAIPETNINSPMSESVKVGSLLDRAIVHKEIQAAPLLPEDIASLGLNDAVFQLNSAYVIAVPLLNRRRELTGAMVLFAAQPSEKDLLSFIDAFSGTAAVSLEAQAMIKEQKELFESFIHVVADAIDTKSPYTGGHCVRVPELVKLLAEATCETKIGPYKDFSMSDSDWETLRIAAWLHDCGKMTTPEYVVDKATKLETIYNRIHEIRTRFEVLKRDAQLRHMQRLLDGEDKTESQKVLDNDLAELDADFAFVAECNEGTESLSEEKCVELARIARRTWLRTMDSTAGLSYEERARLTATEKSRVPVEEFVLSDRIEQQIQRSDHDTIAADNPWGFNMKEPKLLYNLGELYNLCIRRGTLTEEERYKIKEHIIQTEIMLDKLSFPRHLKRVPQIAAAHHEALDGSGYPKGLKGAQIPAEARMLAIADIFEALTATDRPYKQGLRLSEAIRIMAKMRDEHHIDADLFEIFLRSGVYLTYATRYMAPEKIDAVDVSAILS